MSSGAGAVDRVGPGSAVYGPPDGPELARAASDGPAAADGPVLLHNEAAIGYPRAQTPEAAARDREEWLAWRRLGIGASDAAGVVGLSPWSSPISVWLDKVGLAGDIVPTEAMRWGIRLEPIVIEAFEDETGLRVTSRGLQVTNVLQDLDWMRATLDGVVRTAEEVADSERLGGFPAEPLAVYEGKTAGDWASRDWDEGVPEHYQVQVQHQLAITGLDAGYVVALLGGQRLVSYVLPRDQAAIDLLLELEEVFWRRHVLARVPPAMDGSERTSAAIKAAFAQAAADRVELDESDLELVRQVQSAAADEKEAKERGELWKNSLRLRLGEAQVGVYLEEPLVTWKQHTVNRLDGDALRAAEPAIAARFTRPSPERRLLFPKRKGDPI